MTHRPTATISVLKRRSELLQQTRQFFHDHRYWEVETPLLCRESVIDTHLEPFVVPTTENGPFFLQTSPEFCMKRLLVAGAERIYQITHAFRQEEAGSLHNPEFSMLEWYAVGIDQAEQMQLIENYCRLLLRESSIELPAMPFLQLSYIQAFQKYLNLPVLEMTAMQLAQFSRERIPHAIPDLDASLEEDHDFWCQLLLTECIEPEFKKEQALFLYNYPRSQAALARTAPDDSRVAERFELYLHGIEICNGYRELLDADEFQQRCEEQNQQRQQHGLQALPMPRNFIAAMEQGLPDSTGVALGLDRLFMLALGAETIQDVLTFPWQRV